MKVHALRDNLRFYSERRLAILSIFDFAESYGANTADLYVELGSLNADKAEADGLYLSGEFDASYSRLEEATERLNSLAERAVELKDQALFWVYVIEWLSVAGTSLVCGVALWALMVRRVFYRQAGTTRFDASS